MRLLYKPFAIIGALISARIGKSLFTKVWSRVDDEPPPKPGDGRGSLGKVVAGEAVQAAVMGATAAAVDRLLARFFHHLIGIWPKKPPKSDED